MVSTLLSTNVHAIERVARVLMGVGLRSLSCIGPRTPLGSIGLLPLVAGVVGVCPASLLFGVSSCRKTS